MIYKGILCKPFKPFQRHKYNQPLINKLIQKLPGMNDLLKTPLIIVSFAFLYGIFLFINSCSKNPFCNVKSGESGIIISNYSFDCIAFDLGPKGEQVIIDSDSSFKAFIDKDLEHARSYNCDINNFLRIDFTQHTLLGLDASGGGCDIGFERIVNKDDTNKLYKYTVKVTECGGCKQMAKSMNWVLVPKLPQDYKVEFEVK